MNLNSPQKAVLVVCAGAVASMMLYPPLHYRGYGRGYGWLFTIENGLTVNATQPLVQWAGVCLVGAIVFLLAGTQKQSGTVRAPGLAVGHSWKRISIYCIVAALSVLALGLWIGHQPESVASRTIDLPGAQPNPFDAFGLPSAASGPRP